MSFIIVVIVKIFYLTLNPPYLVLDIEDGLFKVFHTLLFFSLVTVNLALAHKIFKRVADSEVEVTADVDRLNTAQILQPRVMNRMLDAIIRFCISIHILYMF